MSELDKVMLTDEEITKAYIKACTSNELCDETNGSRGVAKAAVAKARPIIAEEIFGEIEARWDLHNDGLNPPWIKLDYSEYQALKERYQGEKK